MIRRTLGALGVALALTGLVATAPATAAPTNGQVSVSATPTVKARPGATVTVTFTVSVPSYAVKRGEKVSFSGNIGYAPMRCSAPSTLVPLQVTSTCSVPVKMPATAKAGVTYQFRTVAIVTTTKSGKVIADAGKVFTINAKRP